MYIGQVLSGKTHIQAIGFKSLCGVNFPERTTTIRPELMRGERVCKRCIKVKNQNE